MQIILTTQELHKNPNTKTTYVEVNKESVVISEEHYNNFVDEKSIKFFRRLGGIETVTKNYTCRGFKTTKIVSTSPDRQIKKIRTFKFN